MKPSYDIVIIGGGPAGMAAALGARARGIERILVLDREGDLGGILLQCIHAGFGLHLFKEELTGPEFAHRYLTRILEDDIDYVTRAFVTDVTTTPDGAHDVCVISPERGLEIIRTRAIILAMGCREQTRAGIHIPGQRPSGIMTAGCAQKMTNIYNELPGRRVAILGSGDIGLIMARRLSLEGAHVVGVFERMPYSNGLTRNIVQCLHDFDIPLHLSTTIVNIEAPSSYDRMTGVEVAPVDTGFNPVLAERRRVECDALLLSVGLIPDTVLAIKLGLDLNPVTRGPRVNSRLETSRAGIFACGNVLHVHDLVDFVAQEGARAGAAAAEWILNQSQAADDVQLTPGANVRYVLPGTLRADVEQPISLRVTRPIERARLVVSEQSTENPSIIYKKKIPLALPAEMISFKLLPKHLQTGARAFRVDVTEGEA